MSFYLYEMMMMEMKQIREDEEKQQKEHEKEYGSLTSQKSMMSNMNKTFSQSTRNLNLGNSLNGNMPKISIPKL